MYNGGGDGKLLGVAGYKYVLGSIIMLEECWLISHCSIVSMVVDVSGGVLGGVGVHGTVPLVAVGLLVG